MTMVYLRPRPFRYSHTIGHWAGAGVGFQYPIDLAFGEGGLLYVVNRPDAQGARLRPLGEAQPVRVGIWTLDEEFLGDFGSLGEGDGQFVWPRSIARDSKGNLYVSDEHRHDVQVFDKDGQFLRKWGGFGSGPGQLNRPAGLAVDPEDNVIVADAMNNRIKRFRSDGRELTSWGSAGNGPGELNLPWGVGVDTDGNVYVADWRNDRIQKFSRDGEYLMTIGTSGSAEGQLKRPADVSVDLDGNVYVADWGNDRISAFTAEGYPFATLIGDSGLSKMAAADLADHPEVVAGRALVDDMTIEKRFYAPTAVEVDAEGHVLVADSCRYRLQVYERVKD